MLQPYRRRADKCAAQLHAKTAIRGTVMLRILVIASLAISLQACARGGDTQPSYLGSALLGSGEADAQEATQDQSHPNLKHVDSNKVLGAMAFQKVTGRPVDPSRLQSGQ